MTRKHFIELAKIVAAARIRFQPETLESRNRVDEVICYFEAELSDYCTKESPRFKRERFAKACNAAPIE